MIFDNLPLLLLLFFVFFSCACTTPPPQERFPIDIFKGKKLHSRATKVVLGSGRKSFVYQASDASDHAVKVAIKVFNISQKKTFDRESSNLMAIGYHPLLPQLLATYYENGLWKIAQKIIPGVTLVQRLAKDGAINRMEVIAKYLSQLLIIVNYLHGKGMIHRDIWPGNIMIDAEDNLRLLDFGDAAQGVQGTKGYMSLERTHNYLDPMMDRMGEVGMATDYYSIAMVAYSMCSGNLDIAPKYSKPPSCGSGDLDNLIAVMMNGEQEERWTRLYVGFNAIKRHPFFNSHSVDWTLCEYSTTLNAYAASSLSTGIYEEMTVGQD